MTISKLEVLYSNRTSGNSGKEAKWLQTCWGPSVTGIKGKHVSLASKNAKLMANMDQLAHYIEPEERIPSELRKGSGSPLACVACMLPY